MKEKILGAFVVAGNYFHDNDLLPFSYTIYNRHGRILATLKRENSFPYFWILSDNEGRGLVRNQYSNDILEQIEFGLVDF